MKKKKIALIGCGNVGCSFVYSAINNNVGDEYILIDVNNNAAMGQAIDLVDSIGMLQNQNTIVRAGTYADCGDADVIVITAGRPQRENETRLDMIRDNSKIMKSIANAIKATKFSGVTVIASNPVDILTLVYQETTQYDIHRVMGSGTLLDTSRFRVLMGRELDVNPSDVNMSVLGEHGDTSIITCQSGSIFSKPIKDVIAKKLITTDRIHEIHKEVINRAYEIIKLKGSTYFGIGVCLAKLVQNIVNNTNKIETISVYLEGQYGNKGLYIGVPAIINNQGWSRVIELELSKQEQIDFTHSCQTVQDSYNKIKD